MQGAAGAGCARAANVSIVSYLWWDATYAYFVQRDANGVVQRWKDTNENSADFVAKNGNSGLVTYVTVNGFPGISIPTGGCMTQDSVAVPGLNGRTLAIAWQFDPDPRFGRRRGPAAMPRTFRIMRPVSRRCRARASLLTVFCHGAQTGLPSYITLRWNRAPAGQPTARHRNQLLSTR